MPEPHESRIYSNFAPVYDSLWGRAFVDHEHEAIESLNLRPGQCVLEVGVGTGISLDAYPPYAHVVGIDPSERMLNQAHKKVVENGWSHVELRQGDALKLEFPDESFDDIITFHVISVVPDPALMMREMVRVCKRGGRLVIINHFASASPFLYWLGKMVNPLCKPLGWSTRLRVAEVLDGQPITVERNERLSRWSVHRTIVCRKG